MAQKLRRTFVWTLAAVAFAGLVACQPKSPEQEVAELRASYTVQLNAWIPQKGEPADEVQGAAIFDDEVAVMDDGETAGGETAGDGAMSDEGGEEAATEPAGPQTLPILFDLAVRFNGRGKKLAGMTVDVTHADVAQHEKAVYRQWIETGDIVKGDTVQRNFVLTLPLAEGDAFSVEVVPGVPADLSQYREFAQPSP